MGLNIYIMPSCYFDARYGETPKSLFVSLFVSIFPSVSFRGKRVKICLSKERVTWADVGLPCPQGSA
jgi:hypothetical protein